MADGQTYCYRSLSGVTVRIPKVIDPCEVFAMNPTMEWKTIRCVFMSLVAAEGRDVRAVATLSYEMMRVLCHKNPLPPFFCQISPSSFSYDVTDPIVMTYIGDGAALSRAISADRSVIEVTAEEKCPLVYLAARSGHNDIIQLLFRKGANVNARGNGSSALHAAAFFGHAIAVQQLIALGASLTFKNRYNSLPIEEASIKAIKNCIRRAGDNLLGELLRQLMELKMLATIETITDEGTIVGYRVLRRLDDRATILSQWKLGWHGTTRESLLSIFKSGLKKPGEPDDDGTMICERVNHIQPNIVVAGRRDWSRAVFVSPVLTYAAHPCHAARISSREGTGKWCILVQASIRPKTFTIHPSTIAGKYLKQGESTELEEMRVEPGEDEKVLNLRQDDVEIVRVSSSSNVTVVAALLANDEFIQETTLSVEKLSNLMQGSDIQESGGSPVAPEGCSVA
jgi:hypothetical protein